MGRREYYFFLAILLQLIWYSLFYLLTITIGHNIFILAYCFRNNNGTDKIWSPKDYRDRSPCMLATFGLQLWVVIYMIVVSFVNHLRFRLVFYCTGESNGSDGNTMRVMLDAMLNVLQLPYSVFCMLLYSRYVCTGTDYGVFFSISPSTNISSIHRINWIGWLFMLCTRVTGSAHQ